MLGDVAGQHSRRNKLILVIERLRRRFDIVRVCVVADRGMIAAETIAELEARKLLYILGVRERSDKLVRELVLGNPAPFVPLVVTKRGKEASSSQKTRQLRKHRYQVHKTLRSSKFRLFCATT